jgi:hypothetical protein
MKAEAAAEDLGGKVLEEVGFGGNILEGAQTAVDFDGKIC